MTKDKQRGINIICGVNWDNVIDEFLNYSDYLNPKRLRTCNAIVYETDNYYILRSYNTLVAAIDKNDNRIFDMLRKEYGYTSTSAQHIAKFIHDYTPYPWNSERLTWRYVSAK